MSREASLCTVEDNCIWPLQYHCGMTVDEAIDWLYDPDWSDPRIPDDITAREDVGYGLGYINGVATALDESVLDLLTEVMEP